MSYQEFKNKSACKTNFFQFYQVISAIPKHLVTKAKNIVPLESELNIKNSPFFQLDDLTAIHFGKAKTRDFYCLFNKKNSHEEWSWPNKMEPNNVPGWRNMEKNI